MLKRRLAVAVLFAALYLGFRVFDPGPTRICPVCQGTGQADPVSEDQDPWHSYYHAEGSAWLPPSSRATRSPMVVVVPATCPRCHGRGLIGR
jgi:DnaJ-class molecular chaperone